MIDFLKYWEDELKKKLKEGKYILCSVTYEDERVVFVLQPTKEITDVLDKVKDPVFIGEYKTLEEVEKMLDKEKDKETFKNISNNEMEVFFVKQIMDAKDYSELKKKETARKI